MINVPMLNGNENFSGGTVRVAGKAEKRIERRLTKPTAI
jgi:hypothetical protein